MLRVVKTTNNKVLKINILKTKKTLNPYKDWL
jgi:hypothetical protein